MAINLSPRPYNIDPTGRDYVLDPAPLMRAQEKNFQTQNETMKMVYETGRKGMEFAEYLGARQQLGRVKAQLSELDPNDPEFHRRLSSIIADNPLALENPNTAPGLKMALVPLAAAASKAQEQRYALERITETYGGRSGLQAARVQGQMDVWQHKQDNAPLTEAEKRGLGVPLPERRALTETPPATDSPAFTVTPGDKLLVPVPAQPAAAQNAGTPTARPSANGNDIVFGPDDSLMPSGPTGENVPTTLPVLTEAQQAAGVEQASDGTLWQRKSVGKGASFTPYKVAPEKPTTPLPEGKEWMPELHEGTNDVKGWKAKAAPKLSEQSQTQLKDYIKRMAAEDPESIALAAKVDAATANFEKAKRELKRAESAKDEDAIADADRVVVESRRALLDYQTQQHARGVAFGNQALRVLDPKFIKAAAQFRAAAGGADSILETPPPITAPPITAIPAAVPVVPATTAGKLDAALKAFK